MDCFEFPGVIGQSKHLLYNFVNIGKSFDCGNVGLV